MNLSEVKTVKVGDLEFHVKITNRSMIDYEKLTGESILNFEGTERLLKFFYCTAKAGAKAMSKEFGYSFDEFLNLIDDYPTETMTNFSKAIFTEPGGEEKKQKIKSSK
jgi:hypothetical protein